MTKTDNRAQTAAALLLAARRTGKRTAAFPRIAGRAILPRPMRSRARPPASRRHRRLEDRAPSPTAACSFAPIFAVVAGPARFPAASQHLFGIEAEIAFRFARDLPPHAEPYRRDEVIAAFASVHPAIELVDTRFADWPSIDGLSKLADNQ
jgi:2-keto-4-pentenoate hydratase